MDFLLNYQYLTPKRLNGFDKYKYKSVDTSPLSNYVMHPFWNQLVKVYPLWVPANMLTLVGWILSLLTMLIISYYDPHCLTNTSIPSSVWFLAALFTFWAHQLDGTDGKQARRTNSSSPLGELFDHGLDSSAVWLMVLSNVSCFGIGAHSVVQIDFVFIFYFTLFAFNIAHWEKYTTSVMFLPWAYDISQIWLASAYMVTFFNGVDTWKLSLGGVSMGFMFKCILIFLVLAVCLPFSIANQVKARRDSPGDCVTVWESIQPLTCLCSVTVLHFFYGYLSTGDLINTQIRLFLISYGILFSNLNCRLIVAQMSGGQCERFNTLAYPLLPMMLLSWFKICDDSTVLLCYVVFLTCCQLHYGINVVRQLCDHLNVYCFKVGKPPARKPTDSTNGSCKHAVE